MRKITRVGAIADVGLFRSYDFTRKLNEEFQLAPGALELFLFDPDNSVGQVEGFQVFNEKSFGYNGAIKSKGLRHFAEKEFELMINYCNGDQVYPEVLMARSAALLKAGFAQEGTTFQDISIKVPSNRMDAFHKELVRYLDLLELVH